MRSFADVSVVIPTHNRADLVGEAIRSVVQQTLPVGEIIVVDDGSTDETAERIRTQHPGVIVVRQEHRGAAAARNRGMQAAKHRWIAFLDSDDLWTPAKIAAQLRFAERHPHARLLHSGYTLFGDTTANGQPRRHFLDNEYRIEYLLCAEDWICTSSVLLRADAAIPFREWAETSSEDILFFGDLLRAKVAFCYVDERLVGHRVHAGATGGRNDLQIRGASCQWRWIDEVFAADLAEQRRLQADLLGKVVQRLSAAKRARDWESYWAWRCWLTDRWPANVERPGALDERIHAPLLYALQAALGRIKRRFD